MRVAAGAVVRGRWCVVRSFYPMVALRLAEGVGDSSLLRLPADFTRAFCMLKTAAGRRQLGRELGASIPDIPWDAFDRQVEALERAGVRGVSYFDPDYPRGFRDIAQPPPFLLYRGDIALLRRSGVAIVGSRNASVAGCRFATRLARDLASLGIPVVSGLALGIDSAAHRGALDGEGRTIAVIGTGLDVSYPRGNGSLTRRIAESGCVITEQLMGRAPEAFVFPLRNRMISAAAHIVIVVEAAARSGALVTAKWALEQGREVGAVPRFPGDARSAGVNRLLKSGAYPVESVEDILAAVPRLNPGAVRAAGHVSVTELPPDERAVMDAIGGAPADADAVSAHIDRPAAEVQRILLDLEIRGLVARDATGAYYALE